jgi:CubicO group peptidase (beta-lactamase class C family)
MVELGKLDDFIFEKLSKTHLPGLSAAIVKDGTVVYSRGFSFRNTEYGLRATPDTLYGIRSVTKSFTALSVMQLVEKGKLSVDDPIGARAQTDVKMRTSGQPRALEPLGQWFCMCTDES